jgi:uncharacterized protein DUF6777
VAPEPGDQEVGVPERARGVGGYIALVVVAAVLTLLVIFVVRGCTDRAEEAQGQTVRYQSPTDIGPDPFTQPADRKGDAKVPVESSQEGSGASSPDGGSGGSDGESSTGAGPYGGSGSDLVCDRELLIRSLTSQPDRLRAWAGVLGVEPTSAAVSRYIRSLRAVTLQQDTRVTNHTFANGKAVPLQSILAAGTAVLVDKEGKVVVRCRCGNPLLPPVEYTKVTCVGCPPRYSPPPPCRLPPWFREHWRPRHGGYKPGDFYDPYDDPWYPKRFRPKEGVRYCYIFYPYPPRVKGGPRPPRDRTTTTTTPTYTEPDYTITDRYPGEYTEPQYTEPKYREPRHTEPEYTEPEYTEPEYTEPEHTPPPEETPEPEPAPPNHADGF